MATTPKSGTFNIVYIDETTAITTALTALTFPGNFQPVVCLTTNAFNGTRDSIDTSSKCSGLWKTSIPGQAGWTITGDGQAVELTGSDITADINFRRIWQLYQSGEKFFVAMEDTDSYSILYGVGYITNITITAPNNAVKTFSFTVQGDDRPYDQTMST